MRQFLLALVLLFSMIYGFAQEHLSFKGIPIEGNLEQFCKKLEADGFTKITSERDIAVFTGYFASQFVQVGVGATDDGQNVHTVGVLFDESDEWNLLVNTYDYLKSLYTRKYGDPKVSIENNPSSSDNNVSKMFKLSSGEVTYGSGWQLKEGSIELLIEKSATTYGYGNVKVFYRDTQNIEARIQNDLNDI